MLANSAGFGLLAHAADLQGRQRAGKAFLTLEDGELLLPPVVVAQAHRQVACLSGDGRLLVFALSELKLQPKGGRGLTLMAVDAKAPLLAAVTLADSLTVQGSGRGGKPKDEVVKGVALAPYQGKRARKGRMVEGLQKVLRLV